MERRQFCACMGGLAAPGGHWALAASASASPQSVRALALGTTVTLTVCDADHRLGQRALAAAVDEIHRVERLMSIYDEASQVAQLNRRGLLKNPDPSLLEVLKRARDYFKRTAGAFDITVQPLWELYRAAAGHVDHDARQRARERVGMHHLTFDRQHVRLSPGSKITLNGIAQGFATDRAQAVLREHGIEHALVDVGEIAAMGQKQREKPWRVGVQHPREQGAYLATTLVENRCLATSGDYATTFSADFEHHHIFDPASGHSPQQLSSVSVLAPTATEADAMSTALMVLGKDRGRRLLADQPQLDALLVTKGGKVLATPGFSGSTPS